MADRTAAAHPAHPAGGGPARAPAWRHGMGGAEPWLALCPRIRFQFLVRGPGRGNITNFSSRSTLHGNAAGSPNSTAPRWARCFWSGTPTMSPNCDCCWSIRPGAARDWEGGWSANASVSLRQCGYRKITLWTQSILVAARKIYRMPVSFWWPTSRTAASARPDRRNLGAGAVNCRSSLFRAFSSEVDTRFA